MINVGASAANDSSGADDWATAAANAAAQRSADVILAGVLFAIDPQGLGGLILTARHSPARNAYLDWVMNLLPPEMPRARIAPHTPEDRLLGGLDLSATLAQGRPVMERGVIAATDGGVIVLSNAERTESRLAAHLAHALDHSCAPPQRSSAAASNVTRIAVIALNEQAEPEEQPPPALKDRLALHVGFDQAGDLVRLPPEAFGTVEFTPADVVRARLRLHAVEPLPSAVEALTAGAVALGIGSIRAPLLALRVARAHAALEDRIVIEDEDIAAAVRLVLVSRATRMPAAESADDQALPPPPPPDQPAEDEQTPSDQDQQQALEDLVLEAARSALTAEALNALRAANIKSKSRNHGRAPEKSKSQSRGRPKSSIAGSLGRGTRLDLVATLRTAAPWQLLRRRLAASETSIRVHVRPSDFRIKRFEEQTRRTTVFVVDASGSSAINRLAETKGAVETLLAESYVRRDRVALIAFRNEKAEVLLPPTRALARAKRALSGLPGGGPTPLASGIETAEVMLATLRRTGEAAMAVVLTDGRGNVARDGTKGRTPGDIDAIAAAERFRRSALDAILIDTSARPDPAARRIAETMGAHYLPLPFANATAISRAVKAAADA